MKTATLEKYPLLSEVETNKAGEPCKWLYATCSTCRFCQEPDDGYLTDDYRPRCTYYTKDEINRVLV